MYEKRGSVLGAALAGVGRWGASSATMVLAEAGSGWFSISLVVRTKGTVLAVALDLPFDNGLVSIDTSDDGGAPEEAFASEVTCCMVRIDWPL